MGFRHATSDADWDRVENPLPEQHRASPGTTGGSGTRSWGVARTEAAWRDVPERLGNGNAQWRRFDGRAAAGRFAASATTLRDPDLDVRTLASAAVPRPRHGGPTTPRRW